MTWGIQQQDPCNSQKIPNVLTWTLENVTIPKDNGATTRIIAMIIQEKGQCLSDGTIKDELGTMAAIFMELKEANTYILLNRTPGTNNKDQNLYRSEL